MIPPCIRNGKAFVGCPSRLGTVKKDGPVTGKKLVISIQGNWINEEDADELTANKEDVWCFRENGLIKIYTVFYLNPSEAQLRSAYND